MPIKNNTHSSFIIFGGAGFLGQHLVYLLLEKYPDSKIWVFQNNLRYKIIYSKGEKG